MKIDNDDNDGGDDKLGSSGLVVGLFCNSLSVFWGRFGSILGSFPNSFSLRVLVGFNRVPGGAILVRVDSARGSGGAQI